MELPSEPEQPGSAAETPRSSSAPEASPPDVVRAGRLLAFGSLKGGVGKTTLSMLAARALFLEGRKVVLIDADIIGTEASVVLMNEIKAEGASLTLAGVSLVEVFDRIPDSESVIRWIEKQIDADLKRHPSIRCVIVPSFSHIHTVQSQRAWRDVLEKSGLYVQRRMRDLVSAWRSRGFDVVVDLPAFDVGFAKEARAALEREPECKVFFVTDADVRSINATLAHLKEMADERDARKANDPDDKTPEPALVINRVPPGKRARSDDELLTWDVIELERDEQGIELYTRHTLYEGEAGKGLLSVLDGLIKAEKLGPAGLPLLRGEP